jgi:hypothetical protein
MPATSVFEVFIIAEGLPGIATLALTGTSAGISKVLENGTA